MLAKLSAKLYLTLRIFVSMCVYSRQGMWKRAFMQSRGVSWGSVGTVIASGIPVDSNVKIKRVEIRYQIARSLIISKAWIVANMYVVSNYMDRKTKTLCIPYQQRFRCSLTNV